MRSQSVLIQLFLAKRIGKSFSVFLLLLLRSAQKRLYIFRSKCQTQRFDSCVRKANIFIWVCCQRRDTRSEKKQSVLKTLREWKSMSWPGRYKRRRYYMPHNAFSVLLVESLIRTFTWSRMIYIHDTLSIVSDRLEHIQRILYVIRCIQYTFIESNPFFLFTVHTKNSECIRTHTTIALRSLRVCVRACATVRVSGQTVWNVVIFSLQSFIFSISLSLALCRCC